MIKLAKIKKSTKLKKSAKMTKLTKMTKNYLQSLSNYVNIVGVS